MFRNSITQVKRFPSTDIGVCDHVSIVAEIRLNLKKIKKKKSIKRDWRLLGEETVLRGAYVMEAVNRFKKL